MKRKIKFKNLILFIITLILLFTLAFSTYKIIVWFIDNDKTDKQIEKVKELVEVEEVEDTSEVEIIENTEEVDEFNPYWDYIDMKLINVDFNNLLKENSDTVGWLQVNGTKINYPFVQTGDNTYYLTHSFNKRKNSSGWVFLDYRNNIKELDKNTIIYAHGRVNGTMFGSLKKTLDNSWLNNTDNHVVKLSTLHENTLWQVFSVYHIPTTNDYISVSFDSDDSFTKFADMLIKRSVYNFNTTVSSSDKILTLSTCYNDQEKMVLHAKLIKREER